MVSANKAIKAIALCSTAVLFNTLNKSSYLAATEYDDDKKNRDLSLNLGNGDCKWKPPNYDTPEDIEFFKTLIVGYPSGDKRVAFIQMEAITGFAAKDEWDFKYLGMTNNPFIKANYPHHEGIWGWEDVADQVILVVRNMRRSMVEYHDILWDIGYATTWYEVAERLTNLYANRPPVEDFLEWRDDRVLDEVHYYGWFIDFWMEGGLMRDVFTNNITTPEHWEMFQLPHHYSRSDMAYESVVGDEEVTPSYDLHCTNDDITNGCFPAQIISGEHLVDHDDGPIEARKLALALNRTGMAEHMIAEEAWDCIWRELHIHKKGGKIFLDREGVNDRAYNFSLEMLNEMVTELDRLITKYSSGKWESIHQAQDLVALLTEHRVVIDSEKDDVLSGRRRLTELDFLGKNERKRRKIERIELDLKKSLDNNFDDKEELSRMARATWLRQEEEKVVYDDFFKMVEKKLYENRKERIKTKTFAEDIKRKEERIESYE